MVKQFRLGDGPIELDLKCYKGKTYTQNYYFTQNEQPFSFEGMTVEADIRPYENSKIITARFICTIFPEYGMLNLYLDHETTAAIEPGNYKWDMKTTDSNDYVVYWFRGKFIVNGRVTE